MTISDVGSMYMVSVTKEIPENCHLYIAAYDSEGRLVSVKVTHKADVVSKDERMKIIKTFIMYDNMKPVMQAKEKEIN